MWGYTCRRTAFLSPAALTALALTKAHPARAPCVHSNPPNRPIGPLLQITFPLYARRVSPRRLSRRQKFPMPIVTGGAPAVVRFGMRLGAVRRVQGCRDSAEGHETREHASRAH